MRDGKEVMHYTSLDVLLALARKERYRLYDSAGVTDRSEGMAAFDFLDSSNVEMAQKGTGGKAGSRPFMGSFVVNSNPDTGDEMMWQTYGQQSSGCALVFGHQSFAAFQENENLGVYLEAMTDGLYIPHRERHLCKVAYLRDVNRKTLKKIVERIDGVFQRYPQQSILLLDSIRFFFKAERYEREGEARIVVWRGKGADDASGRFPRAYVECYADFRPKKILLGPKAEKPELWKEWLGRQPGTKDIDVEIAV